MPTTALSIRPRLTPARAGALAAALAMLVLSACAKREPLPPSLVVISYAAPGEFVIDQPFAAVLAATRDRLAEAGSTFAVSEPAPGTAAVQVQERQYEHARYWIYQPSITIISEAVQTDGGRKPHHWHVVDLRYPDGVPSRRRDGAVRESLGDTPPTLDPHSFALPYVDGVLSARMIVHLQQAGDRATKLRVEVADAKAPYVETAHTGGVWRSFLGKADLLKAVAWQPVSPAKSWLTTTLVAPIAERAKAAPVRGATP